MANKVNTAQLPLGTAVQMASANFSAVATGTGLIPADDTIPQNTEGTEFMTLVITPKATTNVLVIKVTVMASSSVSAQVAAALFQDSVANALAADGQWQPQAGGLNTISFEHSMAAGTLSSTTFKVRAGGHTAGTTTFNGSAGVRSFGAITKSVITITEYKA